MLRKEEQYLDPKTEAERNELISDNQFDETVIDDVFKDFYGKVLPLFHFSYFD